MKTYIATIHKDKDSDYGISFPDFPGCVSAADTVADIQKQAKEALEGHLATMHEYGDDIPEPSSIEDIKKEDSLFLIPIGVNMPGKTERINITAKEYDLRAIDEAAHKAGETRSTYLIKSGLRRAFQSNGKTPRRLSGRYITDGRRPVKGKVTATTTSYTRKLAAKNLGKRSK